MILIHTFFYLHSADIISTVEFNSTGELLATGDKGGRVVVFQREQEVGVCLYLRVYMATGLYLKCGGQKIDPSLSHPKAVPLPFNTHHG